MYKGGFTPIVCGTIHVRRDTANGAYVHNFSFTCDDHAVKVVDHSHRPEHVDSVHLLHHANIRVDCWHGISDSPMQVSKRAAQSSSLTKSTASHSLERQEGQDSRIIYEHVQLPVCDRFDRVLQLQYTFILGDICACNLDALGKQVFFCLMGK